MTIENRNTCGSVWRKWDLHIHSNASDGSATPQEIIDEAIEKGLSVIALTDHHTVKNIDAAKQYAIDKGVVVISGIEFRSEYGDKSVHFIGLFPDSYEEKALDSKALHELILCKLDISETQVVAAGKKENSSLTDDEAFKAGMFKVQVDFKKAATLIHEYGGLVSVHNGSKKNGLDEQVRHVGTGPRNVKELYDCLGTLKEELMSGYIDICEIRKENDDEDFYLLKFKKPSIIASDAHIKSEIGQKYVWIKADPTFDGLKQIIFEPFERVKIQDDEPEQKNDYEVIESVQINHQDFAIQTIPLNQSLNTIIGGRSSGKSILLGSIAKKVGTSREVKKHNPDYEKYIQDQIVPNMVVAWRDGVENSQRSIEYFPQSFINNLAAQSKEVNKLIESTVKNDPEKRSSLEDFSTFCIENKSVINQEIATLFALKEKLVEMKEDLMMMGNKEGVEKQIVKIKDDQRTIKESMGQTVSEEDEKTYKKIVAEQKTIFDQEARSKSYITKLGLLKSKKIANAIDDELIGLDNPIKNRISTNYKKLCEQFQKAFAEELDSIISAEMEIIRNGQSRIQEIENDLVYKKCKMHFSQNAAYLEAQKKMQAEEKKLNEIVVLEKDIFALETKIDSKQKVILELHDSYFSRVSEIVKTLTYTNGDVEITAKPKFKIDDFKALLGVRFSQKSFDIQNLVNYEYSTNDAFKTFLSQLFKRLVNQEIPLKGSYNLHQVLIDILSENFYEVEYDVVFQQDNLSFMSEGKKAFIVLRILLDFNERQCPILIDQPEDDLDNRAIYDELVAYLRTKKKERQIILVTHNPNIVVGGDAEEVIVANQNGVNTPNQGGIKFEYLTGSLENTIPKNATLPLLISQGIKQHVCDVLEGGDEAFLKRENKYGIKAK